jgi:hypothetical protein
VERTGQLGLVDHLEDGTVPNEYEPAPMRIQWVTSRLLSAKLQAFIDYLTLLKTRKNGVSLPF